MLTKGPDQNVLFIETVAILKLSPIARLYAAYQLNVTFHIRNRSVALYILTNRGRMNVMVLKPIGANKGGGGGGHIIIYNPGAIVSK